MAADVAVHGHLTAATAGFEAFLSGTPALLLDRERWHRSRFYSLGKGRVVFNDWEELWRTCCEYWRNPAGVPEFGDWSSMIHELDPFRDGRAVQRMGTYLKWLLDDLRQGYSRDAALVDAAKRYAEIWGRIRSSEMLGSDPLSTVSVLFGKTVITTNDRSVYIPSCDSLRLVSDACFFRV